MIEISPGTFPLALGLFGLIVGSFVNVLVHRLPRGESPVLPRSRCPACGAAIRPWDNVPVISWIVLGGRCRDCRGRISPRYPMVEAFCAALWTAAGLWFDPVAPALVAAVFATWLLALALIDVEHLILPDSLTFSGMAAGLLLQPWIPWTAPGDALLGCLGGAGALFLLAELWYAWRGEEGLGLGDAKMMGMVGAFLGWKGAALAFLVALVVGAIVGLVLLALGRRGLKTALPFGFFLALGALAALLWGSGPVDRYLGLL